MVVTGITNDQFEIDSVIIPPNTQNIIYVFDREGKSKEYECCPCEFSRLSIMVKDSTKTLIKETLQSANWTHESGTHIHVSNQNIQCYFTVTTKDIQ